MKESKALLRVKDYSVSGERFDLVKDSDFNILRTSPQPKANELPAYYKSEDYISHTGHKRNLFEWLYHFVRMFTIRKKLVLINGFDLPVKTLLDFGCGTGSFLKQAIKNNWQIQGIEPNSKARHAAKAILGDRIFDVDHLKNLKPHSFSVITLWHVLEHLPNLEEYIIQFKSLLSENGYLVIAVPNFQSYDAKYYSEFWAAYDAPRHLWHFSREGIKQLFDTRGFVCVDERPMVFDAYYVSLLSEKYRTGRMNPVRSFLVGTKSNFKAMRTKEYSSIIYVFKSIN